jgi:hypothetical protein
MLSFATLTVLSRTRILCRFTATGLACKEIKTRAIEGHPNIRSGRKVRQKMVEDGGAAAEKASKQKHIPTREPSIASSIVSDLALGGAR